MKILVFAILIGDSDLLNALVDSACEFLTTLLFNFDFKLESLDLTDTEKNNLKKMHRFAPDYLNYTTEKWVHPLILSILMQCDETTISLVNLFEGNDVLIEQLIFKVDDLVIDHTPKEYPG